VQCDNPNSFSPKANIDAIVMRNMDISSKSKDLDPSRICKDVLTSPIPMASLQQLRSRI